MVYSLCRRHPTCATALESIGADLSILANLRGHVSNVRHPPVSCFKNTRAQLPLKLFTIPTILF